MSANLLTEREFKSENIGVPKPLGIEKCETYAVNNGATLYKYKKVNNKDYTDYCSFLLNSGYEEKSFDSSVYICRGFIKDNNLVYTYYFEKEELLRIIYEPNAILPSDVLPQSGSCELYQLSLDQSEVDCGMSYVIKLCDGSFFIIDGGYFSKGECDRLYNFLCEHSGDKITISGWFCSHAHKDHFGCF
ncbi:MAG: hypothetical protein ACI4RF_07795, partial [Eubacterium sp.]